MNADLTVVIPMYNQEKYIKECLDSVCKQTICGLQIIVVNDGSTDGSLDICKEYENIDDRICVITQENQGPVAARYTGIRTAVTKYITFVDSDDFILENAYDDAEEYMNSDFDQVFYEITRYYEDGSFKHEKHIFEQGVYDKKRIVDEIFPRLIWDYKKNTPGLECSQGVRIVKRDLLLKAYEKLNGKKFYYGEDWAITLPLTLQLNKMAIISRSYYMHRLRPNNTAPEYISSSVYFDKIYDLYSFLKCNLIELSEYDFGRQLDYLYMYAVDQKKWSYEDYEFHRDFLFPFDKVEKNRRIVLYGAGAVGKVYYKQLCKLQYCSDILWVDRNAKNMSNQSVVSLDELRKPEYKRYDKIIIAIENINTINEIKTFLIENGFDGKKIVW